MRSIILDEHRKFVSCISDVGKIHLFNEWLLWDRYYWVWEEHCCYIPDTRNLTPYSLDHLEAKRKTNPG